MAQTDQTNSQENGAPQTRRTWVTPKIDIAEARGAEAFFGPPGAIDYGFYS